MAKRARITNVHLKINLKARLSGGTYTKVELLRLDVPTAIKTCKDIWDRQAFVIAKSPFRLSSRFIYNYRMGITTQSTDQQFRLQQLHRHHNMLLAKYPQDRGALTYTQQAITAQRTRMLLLDIPEDSL